jgi:mono/diheme cytochrome c family protein
MSRTSRAAGPVTLTLLMGLGSAGCNTRAGATGAAGEIAAQTPRDTPPPGAAKPSGAGAGKGLEVSKSEYEGWRQYSVHCARCHGQDVLPNPVAANLLISLGPGGPISSGETFAQVVTAGRPARGMPAFKGVLTPDQVKSIYTYVKGRAEKRIPPGRPKSPAG